MWFERVHRKTLASIEYFNSYGLNQTAAKLKLCQFNHIINKEKKRLGIKHQKITLDDMGFSEIKNFNNLWNMAKIKKIKIMSITSNTEKSVTIRIKTIEPLTVIV